MLIVDPACVLRSSSVLFVGSWGLINERNILWTIEKKRGRHLRPRCQIRWTVRVHSRLVQTRENVFFAYLHWMLNCYTLEICYTNHWKQHYSFWVYLFMYYIYGMWLVLKIKPFCKMLEVDHAYRPVNSLFFSFREFTTYDRPRPFGSYKKRVLKTLNGIKLSRVRWWSSSRSKHLKW